MYTEGTILAFDHLVAEAYIFNDFPHMREFPLCYAVALANIAFEDTVIREDNNKFLLQ